MLSGRMAFIGTGALAMLGSMLLQKKQYPQVTWWKMILLTLWLTITGVAGTMILAYIETGAFGGTSFFGAVILVPILITPALLMKIDYKDILNLCATAGCAMLFVMRFDCLNKGCCFGRYIPALEIQFPSQIAEMVVAVIMIITLIQTHRKNRQAQLYPRFMIMYGVLRFILNGFRYGGTNPWIFGLSQGHFWSLVSVTIGAVWILLSRARKPVAGAKK